MVKINGLPGHVSRQSGFQSQGRGNQPPKSHSSDHRVAHCSGRTFNKPVETADKKNAAHLERERQKIQARKEEIASEQDTPDTTGATTIALTALAIAAKKSAEGPKEKNRLTASQRKALFRASHRS